MIWWQTSGQLTWTKSFDIKCICISVISLIPVTWYECHECHECPLCQAHYRNNESFAKHMMRKHWSSGTTIRGGNSLKKMRKHFGTTHSVLDDQPNAMATPSTTTQITAPGNCETKDRERVNCLIRENINLQKKIRELKPFSKPKLRN